MGQTPGPLLSVRLIDPETGWALAEHRLFWTTDAGNQWKDITPRNRSVEEIASVFLNASTGWVLLSDGIDANEEPHFNLAFTNSGGATLGLEWSCIKTNWIGGRIVHLLLDCSSLGIDGEHSFDLDPQRGWASCYPMVLVLAHVNVRTYRSCVSPPDRTKLPAVTPY